MCSRERFAARCCCWRASACCTLLIGTGTAWLVTMYRFPGRRYFQWLLLLPLAIPTYIIAYSYLELLDYSGTVQSALRALFGWRDARSYWFPDIRSLGGAILGDERRALSLCLHHRPGELHRPVGLRLGSEPHARAQRGPDFLGGRPAAGQARARRRRRARAHGDAERHRRRRVLRGENADGRRLRYLARPQQPRRARRKSPASCCCSSSRCSFSSGR